MGVYDIAADREPHPHAGAPARVQRLEDVIYTFRLNSLTPVYHADLHLLIVKLTELDRDQFVAPLACRNTMQGILQQVDQHQLDLQGVGENRGRSVTGSQAMWHPPASPSASMIRMTSWNSGQSDTGRKSGSS